MGVSYSLPCKMIALIDPLKNGFWGQKGKIWSPGQIDPKGTHPPPKHVFGCTERKSTLARVSCGRFEGTKKFFKKAREGTTSPIWPPHPPFLAATIFCLWGRIVDLITRARFQVNRFRGFGAPGGRTWPSPIDLAHRPYNSVRTNVLHCDVKKLLSLKHGLRALIKHRKQHRSLLRGH